MEVREKLKRQIEEIKKSLFGIDEIIKIFVLSKAADLTILMLGEHAIAKSLSKNTQIIVSREGYSRAIPIEKVKKKDKVIGLDNLEFVICDVEDVKRFKEKKELLKITTSSGRKVEATKDHSFLIWDLEKGKWIPKLGENLEIGDIVPIFRTYDLEPQISEIKTETIREHGRVDQEKHPLDFSLGFIFGAYLSEGNLYRYEKTGQTYVQISNYSKKFKEKLSLALKEHHWPPQSSKKGIRITDKELYNLLLDYCGKYSGNKDIKKILFGPRDFRLGILSGYFSGNGSIHKGGIGWTTKSKKLRDKIAFLLGSVGISSSFLKPMKVKSSFYYRGHIVNRDKFKEIVPIFRDKVKFPEKRKYPGKFELCIPSKNKISKIASRLKLRSGKTKGYFNAYWGRMFRKKILGRQGLQTFLSFLERSGLEKASKEYKEIKELINSSIFFDKIEKIEKITYNDYVFDLETSTGNFMTQEGIIVHNSSLARDWSTTTGLDFRIVTSSEVDEAMLAYIDPAIFREKNIVQMKRGELMLRDHILIDEFFLWSNKFRAKLHQLLEERTYGGLTVLTKTYTFATNPLTEHYSGQIEDRNLATEDRIDLLLPMFQPQVIPTQKMIKKFSKRGRQELELKQIVTWDDYLEARKEIMEVEIPPDLLVWLTLLAESMSACKFVASKFDISRARMQILCSECNQKEHLCAKVALSKPRFLRATLLLSKALAWFNNRKEISIEDLYTVINYTLPHRIIFLKEEKTIFEAKQMIPELLQQFIDDFNNWESRKIFTKLEKIILQAKNPKNPFFDKEKAKELLHEVAENLAINNYVVEAIEKVQETVEKRYKEILRSNPPQTIKEMKEILAKSGLDLYEKGKILDEFLIENPNLTFYLKFERRKPKILKLLLDALIEFHEEEGELKIKPRSILKRKFQKEIDFTSDLLTIREERNRIRITASTPALKKKFETMLRKKK